MTSKKIYVAVAGSLNNSIISSGGKAAQLTARKYVEQVAADLCRVFAADNPRFDQSRFMDAVLKGTSAEGVNND
jgi:hypothetical protein